MDFLLDEGNLPFVVSLGLMIGLGLIEGVGMLLGASVWAVLDSLLPGHLDAGPDATLDIDHAAGVLDWLNVGRVPLMILLVIFLTLFGGIGLVIQSLAVGLTGAPISAALASVPAVVLAVPPLRWFGRAFLRLFPREETYVVSREGFVGLVAVVTLGVAAQGQPAEAKLKDRTGRTQYIQVAPDRPDERWAAGTEVLLTERAGIVFHGVAVPSGVRDALSR